MIKEFQKIEDIYSQPDKSGQQKLIKKNLISSIVLDTNNIQLQEFINNKGKIIKNKCTVKYGNDYYILNHSYKEVKELVFKSELQNPIVVTGFINYNKKEK